MSPGHVLLRQLLFLLHIFLLPGARRLSGFISITITDAIIIIVIVIVKMITIDGILFACDSATVLAGGNHSRRQNKLNCNIIVPRRRITSLPSLLPTFLRTRVSRLRLSAVRDPPPRRRRSRRVYAHGNAHD